jgi:ligand-binding SRPBCC domain-containing protein
MATLEEKMVIQAPIDRCFDLARSVEVHLAGNVHWGEAAVAAGGVSSGLLNLGDRVTWRAKHFGVWQQLTSEIRELERPVYFQDSMTAGPFGFFQHDHWFRVLPAAQTEMTDVLCFAAPFGLLGRLAEAAVLRRYMRGLLRERNAVLREIAESSRWREYLETAQ